MPLSSEKARELGLRGGRPPGPTKETRLKLKAQKLMTIRISKMADKLLNSQAIVALGTHKMVTVEIDEEGKKHVRTVRDETRMQNLLDEGVYGQDYLILEGAPAEWKAANALLDRAFGKAKESLTLDGDVTFSLQALATRRKSLDEERESAIEGELAEQ